MYKLPRNQSLWMISAGVSLMCIFIICSEFAAVEHLGQNAVEAIKKYESVVGVLNDSLSTAEEANQTIAKTLKSLQSITATQLKQEAVAAQNKSQMLISQLQARETWPQGW